MFEPAVEVTTSQSDDGVGAADGPEHAGLFETRADHSLAAGFDHAGADEQVLTAELWVSHSLGISLKVFRLSANLVQNLGIGRFGGAQRENELFDFSLIEQALLAALHPGFLTHG